jgi:hypothetical protein
MVHLMRQVVYIALALALGAVAGMHWSRSGDQEVGLELAITRAVSMKSTFACTGRVYAAILEAGPLTKAYVAKTPTDRLAIRIEPESQKFVTVMSAAVASGKVDPVEHRIIENSKDILIATSFEDRRHVHVFYFDKKDGRLMWTKSSSLIGLKGQSLLYECE